MKKVILSLIFNLDKSVGIRKFVIIIAVSFIIVGCKGGETTGSNAPIISGLSLSPSSANVGDGGGSLTVSAIFDFFDFDGDVATVVVSGPSGETSASLQVSGVTDGTIVNTIVIDTMADGPFTFIYWAIDSKGNTSNKLTAVFTIG